ncbi:MAG: glutamate-1-semialdehyde 2,1-aminomutase [Planctomycetaceae bacterium]|nr:glutamate-1-semialdehyde 2,1-aminomutase [Planctomycetaceae bacterium]
MPLIHDRSHEIFAKAQTLIPGGVNSPARAFGAVGGTPVVMLRGDGPYLYDVDGNQYLDYIGSWGPHILGHRHPQVIEAIHRAVDLGTSFGAPCELENELAELVIDAIPSIELVRMVNSGTEATMSAIRVARGFTGRDLIVKFAGCYHGHVDSLLVKAGSGALTLGTPSSPGIPAGCTDATLVLEYNDCDQLETVFRERGDQIACVILEPVVGNMGTVIPDTEFLQTLRRVCDESGAVLIFDEVMTGFRLAYGGAQSRLGVTPDMTTLGKILGGGLPVGAYGGRRDIMQTVSPLGPVYQAGTLSGNPVAMASGIATLRVLKETNPYPQLDDYTNWLTSGLSSMAAKHGIPHQIPQIGSMFTLFFNDQPVRNYNDAVRSNTKQFAAYFHEMLERGIYLACSQFEANFASAVLTQDDLNRTLQAADEALAAVAAL